MIITSRSNPTLKHIASLKEKKYRRECGEFIVEGAKMVAESTHSSLECLYTVASESYRGDRYGADTVVVPDSIFSWLSDEKTPQGILSVLKIPQRTLQAPRESCLLLDGISDPGNMGTLIRTANAAGYKEIYLVGCTDPYSPKSVRASMSGIFFVQLYFGSIEDVLQVMNVPILSADMSGENIFYFNPPKRFALSIGNEANGISKAVRESSQYTIAIPMDHTAESLNAAVSAGIAMYVLKNKQ